MENELSFVSLIHCKWEGDDSRSVRERLEKVESAESAVKRTLISDNEELSNGFEITQPTQFSSDENKK
jgi:hypothetical protein